MEPCSNRRGNSKDVSGKKLKKGELYALENVNSVRVYKWFDKRLVMMLSTLPELMDELIGTGKRTERMGKLGSHNVFWIIKISKTVWICSTKCLHTTLSSRKP